MQRAFSGEHQKSLDVLQKLVAQVEAWTAEVQHMSEATRSDKEKMVAGEGRFPWLAQSTFKSGADGQESLTKGVRRLPGALRV